MSSINYARRPEAIIWIRRLIQLTCTIWAGHYEIVLNSRLLKWELSKCHCCAHSSLTSKHSCLSGPNSLQSQEEVLALNAAAVIANIKLQRQLSKEKTPNGKSEKDSAPSPPGNTGIISSLILSHVIVIFHLIKHWSLYQLAENVASSTSTHIQGNPRLFRTLDYLINAKK